MTQTNKCPFFNKCGSCLYQDLTEAEYRNKKENFIRYAFRDHGIDVHLEPLISVPLGSRRRVSFAYKQGHIGYNALKSHQIVEITDCPLLKKDIISFLPTLRTWIKKLEGSGNLFILSTKWGLDIHIKPSRPDHPDLEKLELLTELAQNPAVVRLTYNNDPVLEKTKLPFLPDDFLQPSEEGETILTHLLLEEIEQEQSAVDLFCGSGTFTRPLLEKGLKVKGYDCSKSIHLLGTNGVERDLFLNPLLSEELKDLDLIILDPPRAGAIAQIKQIAETPVPKVIMISCNPKTAARDAKILIDAGYTLQKITPVDQFTWSNHVEIVIVFKKVR